VDWSATYEGFRHNFENLGDSYYEMYITMRAHSGRSKEMRSDCPLVTLGLVVMDTRIAAEATIDIETATGGTVRGQKVLSEDGQEVRLFKD